MYDSKNYHYNEYYDNGVLYKSILLKKYSNDLPSLVEYYENGNIKREEYWADDPYSFEEGYVVDFVEHRDKDLPAIIEYYQTGEIHYEEYYKKNVRYYPSRPNGKPASITYYTNGKIKINRYCLDGRSYMGSKKPTYEKFDENGNLIEREYQYTVSKTIIYKNNNIQNEYECILEDICPSYLEPR